MRGQSKLSIKIPKLMVKTMHTKFQFYRSPRAKRGNQFPKKVGNKRSLGKKYEAESDSGEESLLGKNSIGSQDGKEGNKLVYENQAIVGPLSQLLKLEVEEILEPRGAEEGKHNRKNKHPLLPLSSFVDQKKGRNFFKKSCSSEASEDSTKNVVTSWRLLRIKVRSCRLVRVVSKLLTITRSMKKKVRIGDERNKEDEEGQLCLCKKRILMGRRCKPLHSSGTLQYDLDGLLIPDIVP